MSENQYSDIEKILLLKIDFFSYISHIGFTSFMLREKFMFVQSFSIKSFLCFYISVLDIKYENRENRLQSTH